MNKTDSTENWFSRAKAEADKGIPSNDIARAVMMIGLIVFLVASVYSPIVYKFISIKRFKREQKIVVP